MKFMRDRFTVKELPVWCAVGEFGDLGHFFFEDEDGSAITITSVRCIEMLENFLQSQPNELAAVVEDIWFQEDKATEHTAQRTMRYLRQYLPRHIVSHRGDIPWPVRSPDLAPCDFFLWGYFKGEVYIFHVIWLS